MSLSQAVSRVPFNEIEGIAPGNVPAYSNNKSSIFNIGLNYVHGVYTGFRWQCVEYARRWLILRKSCTFKDVNNACNIWKEVQYIERITDGEQFYLRSIANGAKEPPKKDSLLIYLRSTRMPFGHIAVITDVVDNHVHIAEQNNLFHRWNGDYSRRVPLGFRDGLYYIEDSDEIFGWMEIENNHVLHPFNPLDKDKVLQKFLEPVSVGFIGRILGWGRREELL